MIYWYISIYIRKNYYLVELLKLRKRGGGREKGFFFFYLIQNLRWYYNYFCNSLNIEGFDEVGMMIIITTNYLIQLRDYFFEEETNWFLKISVQIDFTVKVDTWAAPKGVAELVLGAEGILQDLIAPVVATRIHIILNILEPWRRLLTKRPGKRNL